MSIEDLGAPLSDAYPVTGGTARAYERGIAINGAGGDAIINFGFPLVGRPTIATDVTPFEPDALNFRLGHWEVDQLVPLIHEALGDRLGLIPTRGPAAAPLPISVGRADVVVPERDTGVGGTTIPAVYGLAVGAPFLPLERQLYDVAFRDNAGQWRVVAPHAFYRRSAWTDFGIAHITDMHVARRIDRFRELLIGAGRPDAAARMYNWNDRFRGLSLRQLPAWTWHAGRHPRHRRPVRLHARRL